MYFLFGHPAPVLARDYGAYPRTLRHVPGTKDEWGVATVLVGSAASLWQWEGSAGVLEGAYTHARCRKVRYLPR
jgi:hypothetical protein